MCSGSAAVMPVKSAPRRERQPRAQRGQHGPEVQGRGHPELRQNQAAPAAGSARPAARPPARPATPPAASRSSSGARAPSGSTISHGQPLARRTAARPPGSRPRAGSAAGPPGASAAPRPPGPAPGRTGPSAVAAGRERVRPGRLQVHRAGQHQPGGGGHRAGREQAGDLPGGLLRDERVDLLPGRPGGPGWKSASCTDTAASPASAAVNSGRSGSPDCTHMVFGARSVSGPEASPSSTAEVARRLPAACSAAWPAASAAASSVAVVAARAEQRHPQRGGDAGRGEDQVAAARPSALRTGGAPNASSRPG